MVQGSWVGLFVLTASLSGHGLLGRMFLFQDLQLNGLWWFGSFFRDGITASTPPLLPARPFLPPPWFRGARHLCDRLTKCCSQATFFRFLVIYSARLHFPFVLQIPKQHKCPGASLYHLLAVTRIFFPK